jgi:hypothetical protein
MVEVLVSPVLPPRIKRKRRIRLPWIGLAVVAVGIALAAVVGGYGWGDVAGALKACGL